MAKFNEVVGFDTLKVVHRWNDSKGGLASGLDRHQNIGKGYIGEKASSNTAPFSGKGTALDS